MRDEPLQALAPTMLLPPGGLAMAATSELSSRRRSSPALAQPHIEPLNKAANFCSSTAVLSPSPTPLLPLLPMGGKRDGGLPLRLRTNSGLSLHTNSAAFRQYTEYSNIDGSPITPNFSLDMSFATELTMRCAGSAADAGSKRGSMSSVQPPGQPRQPASACSPLLCVPDFFSKDVIQTIVCSETMFSKLMKYAERQKSVEGMEFLAKLMEYQQCVGGVAASLSRLGAENSSPATSTRLGLPPDASRLLNAEVKRITRTVLPAIETAFQDAKAHVTQRIVRDVYPGFVKSQISVAAEAALASAHRHTFAARFPGLADSFCLTDPLQFDNPVAFASDGLIDLSGRARAQVVGHNCRVLQGGMTHPLAVARMRHALRGATDASVAEVVLNYRHDADGLAQPFWNLVFFYPLYTRTGRVAFYLGGQVDVSAATASYSKVLDILSAELPDVAELPGPAPPLHGMPRLSPTPTPTSSVEDGSDSGSEPTRRRAASRAFAFSSLRKKSDSALRSQSRASVFSAAAAESPARPPPTPSGSCSGSRSATPQPADAQSYAGAYARHLVLECADGGSGGGNGRQQQLLCTYVSTAALQALGAVGDVLDRDIFDVLADAAATVPKSVRRRLMGSIAAGRSMSTALAVGGTPGLRATSPEPHWSVEAALDWLSDWKSFGGSGGGANSSNQGPVLVCHWTPLKDAAGAVRWVVLIIMPVRERR